MSKMTQNEVLLRHLKSGQSITPRQAALRYGIMRLAARIHELRGDGHPIVDELTEVPTRGGGTTRVAEYRLRSSESVPTS